MRRQDGMPIFQIDMRKTHTVRDFTGASVTHEQLVQAWRVTIAPTVLFLRAAWQGELPRAWRAATLPTFTAPIWISASNRPAAAIKAAKAG
jgi:hypothetical protein